MGIASPVMYKGVIEGCGCWSWCRLTHSTPELHREHNMLIDLQVYALTNGFLFLLKTGERHAYA